MFIRRTHQQHTNVFDCAPSLWHSKLDDPCRGCSCGRPNRHCDGDADTSCRGPPRKHGGPWRHAQKLSRHARCWGYLGERHLADPSSIKSRIPCDAHVARVGTNIRSMLEGHRRGHRHVEQGRKVMYVHKRCQRGETIYDLRNFLHKKVSYGSTTTHQKRTSMPTKQHPELY